MDGAARDAGAEFFTFDSAWWREAWDIYAPIQASEAAKIHAAATGGDYSCFEPRIAERLAWGASLPVAEVEQFRLRFAAFRLRTDALLREFDFVMAPCSPVARLVAGADHTNARKAILSYTTPMSLAGTPVVTLPAAGGAGVQLAAARGADARLVAFAARFGGVKGCRPMGSFASAFRFGKNWGIPPMFCEEWASRLDSAGYGWHVFESVQGIEIIGFAGVRKCNSERRCVDA